MTNKNNQKDQIGSNSPKVNSESQKRFGWFDARIISDIEKENVLLPAVYNSLFFTTLLVLPKQVKDVKAPARFKIACVIDKQDELALIKPDNVDIVVSHDVKILESLMDSKYKLCYFSSVVDQESLNKSHSIGRNFDFILIKLKDETNIPMELILAEIQSSGRNVGVIKEVSTAEDAIIAFGVMEVGSDGIVLSSRDIKEVFELNNYYLEKRKGSLKLNEAEVLSIEHIGIGERGCIDTTSIMTQDEGMLIGSTSTGGILVCSETHYLPYMNLRPFRVNAGAVHSYVAASNNRTAYITDLKAGDEVMCVDSNGNVREIGVGRIKIETRPLLLINCKVGDTPINVIVQDDWHVRVMGTDGKAKNVSTLKKGDKLLAFVTDPGRHVGIAVKEHIKEV